MKTIDLYEKCIKDSRTIPNFINPNSKEHKQANLKLSEMIVRLSFLIQKIILNELQLYKFLIEFEELSSELDFIQSVTLYISCHNYINIKIENYLKQAVDDEEYEVATNLRNFINFRKEWSYIDERNNN